MAAVAGKLWGVGVGAGKGVSEELADRWGAHGGAAAKKGA